MNAGTFHLIAVAALVLANAAFYAWQPEFGVVTCVVSAFALLTALGLLQRRVWARSLLYIAVVANLVNWIYVATTWVMRAHLLQDPWLLNLKRAVPGLVLVILPAVYMIFVAHRYLPRASESAQGACS